MLVVVGVDLGIYLCAPRSGVFTLVEGICVEDTSELDLGLNGTVLVEHPLACILVVRRCEDLLDDELSGACDSNRVIAEVGVLEENAVVFLVDTDGVLDSANGAIALSKVGVEVVDDSFAVATKSQGVGHVSCTVFSKIKSMLALMGMLRCTIWNDHLREGQAVENRSLDTLVCKGDVVQHDSLLVVEANVKLEVLPRQDAAVHSERDTFWLGDVDRLDILPVATILIDVARGVVNSLLLAQWSTHTRDVNVDDGLLGCVVDGAEVKRVLILEAIRVWTVVHESLLETHVASEAFIVANGPGVAVDFVHV
ncbi:hypothetical protein HG530_005619 [Fusarium avenaceum]|nr:hypothetical protein HG530_005619 [Fusarium avenaceum]